MGTQSEVASKMRQTAIKKKKIIAVIFFFFKKSRHIPNFINHSHRLDKIFIIIIKGQKTLLQLLPLTNVGKEGDLRSRVKNLIVITSKTGRPLEMIVHNAKIIFVFNREKKSKPLPKGNLIETKSESRATIVHPLPRDSRQKYPNGILDLQIKKQYRRL